MREPIIHPKSYVYDQLGDKPRGNLYYLKYEADKEIEFWKKESHDHYERWFNLNKQYEGWFGKVMRCERAERELRHQKYKRCLAMVEKCQALYDKYSMLAADDANWEEEDYYFARWRFFEKWKYKWLKLSDKFKPNNEVNNGN